MIRPQLRPLFAQWGIIQAPRPRTVSARSVGWIWKKRSKGCGSGFSAFALSQPFADSATNRLNPESSLRGIWFWGFRSRCCFIHGGLDPGFNLTGDPHESGDVEKVQHLDGK